ncbi:hypothetical protein V1521DRAFT_450497 [Lipomyces starkeyi]
METGESSFKRGRKPSEKQPKSEEELERIRTAARERSRKMRARKEAEAIGQGRIPKGDVIERERQMTENEFVLKFDPRARTPEPNPEPEQEPKQPEPVTPMWSPKRWLSPRHHTEELTGGGNTGPTTPIRQRSLLSNALSFFSSPINPSQRRNPESEASDTPGTESDSEDDVSSSSGSLWEPASPLREPRRMRSIPVSSTRQQEDKKDYVESPPELTDLSKNQWQPDARAPQRRVDRRHRKRIRRRPAVYVEQPLVGPDPLPGAAELERRLILDRQVAIISALVAARQGNSRRGRQLTVDLDEIVEEGQLAVEDFSAHRLQNLMAHEEHLARMNARLGLAN